MAKEKILLVDADPKSIRLLEVSLKKAGFLITSADNGADALEKVEINPPDLIISDTQMPVLDGYKFCEKLKAIPKYRNIPFIFLTRQTDVDDKIRGLELGVDDYLTKPIFIKEVVARVRLLLDRKTSEILEVVEPESKLSGSLAQMGVIDVIQTLEMSRKTGIVTLRSTDKRGKLYFVDGRIINAEAEGLVGEAAVYRILLWSEGAFTVDFEFPAGIEDIIEDSTQGLIMEGMRRIDEWERYQEQLPPLDDILVIDPETITEQHPDQFPPMVEEILNAFGDEGGTIFNVIGKLPYDDLQSLTVVAKLYFEGYLTTSEIIPVKSVVSAKPSKPQAVDAADFIKSKQTVEEDDSINFDHDIPINNNVTPESRDDDRLEFDFDQEVHHDEHSDDDFEPSPNSGTDDSIDWDPDDFPASPEKTSETIDPDSIDWSNVDGEAPPSDATADDDDSNVIPFPSSREFWKSDGLIEKLESLTSGEGSAEVAHDLAIDPISENAFVDDEPEADAPEAATAPAEQPAIPEPTPPPPTPPAAPPLESPQVTASPEQAPAPPVYPPVAPPLAPPPAAQPPAPMQPPPPAAQPPAPMTPPPAQTPPPAPMAQPPAPPAMPYNPLPAAAAGREITSSQAPEQKSGSSQTLMLIIAVLAGAAIAVGATVYFMKGSSEETTVAQSPPPTVAVEPAPAAPEPAAIEEAEVNAAVEQEPVAEPENEPPAQNNPAPVYQPPAQQRPAPSYTPPPQAAPRPAPQQIARPQPAPAPEVIKPQPSPQRTASAAPADSGGEKQMAEKYYKEGQQAYQKGDLGTAAKMYVKALKADPGEARFYSAAGLVLFDMQRDADALKYLRRAVTLDPKDAEAHLTLGMVYDSTGSGDAAMKEYKTFLKLRPNHPRAAEIKRLIELKGGM